MTSDLPVMADGRQQVLRQCFGLVMGERRAAWVGLTLLAGLVSVVEAMGAGLVLTLLQLVTQPDAAVQVGPVDDIRDLLPAMDPDRLILVLSGVMVVFFLLRAALMVTLSFFQARLAHTAGASLSSRLARGYLAMPYLLHLRRNSAELVRNAITSVNQVVSDVVLPAARLVAEVVIAVGLLTVLAVTAPFVSLAAVGVMGPVTYLTLRLVKARQRRYGRTATDAVRDCLKTLQQSLEGIKDLQLLGREEYFGREFEEHRYVEARARYRQAALGELTSVLVETLLLVLVAGFLALTVLVGQSLAVLGLLGYIAVRLKPSIQRIIGAVNKLRFAAPAIDDLHRDIALIERVTADAGGHADLPILASELRLQHVSFHYEGSDVPALEGIDVVIRPGQVVGVCGVTGGGKTTLMDIIVGLLSPTDGALLVDGHDVRDGTRSWQRQLGVVPQHVYMLDDTLRRNIAFGVDEVHVDEDRLAEVVRIAQLDGVVSELPAGLDTVLGERGSRLSGGQRQRVAIARALYRDPEVLVLDEGTSALDNTTERELMAALAALRGRTTVIMVAHRLSTLRDCDLVLVLERGRVADAGPYEVVAARNELFLLEALAPTGDT